MDLPKAYIESADQLLDENGFGEKMVMHHHLPLTKYAPNGDREAIAYQLHGSQDAENIVIESTNFFTYLSSDHQKLRLKAHQRVLGSDYAVIGVEAYDPAFNFTPNEREQISKGSFEPLSVREFRVLDALDISDDQRVLSYGYSMGADVAVQAAYDSQFNSSRANYRVEGLGALEMARCLNRGAVAVGWAMMKSGKKLSDNILASEVPALNESWGVLGLDSQVAMKRVNHRVNKGAASYILAGPGNNAAMVRGFGTAASTKQIVELLDRTNIPILAGRQRDSTVCTLEPISDEISKRQLRRLKSIEEDNDHSADDNIRLSAARILYFATEVVD